ncbi:MAG: DUF3299 domain-containing protein [Candidatus Thiodiazotropha sp.]
MIKRLPLFFLLLTQLVSAAGLKSPAADPWESRINDKGELVLEWDDLVPADFDPDKLFQKITEKFNLTKLDDDDPRAQQIQEEIRQIWNHAPVVESLNGRRVRIPGLMVPLEGDGTKVSEFLLVPYFGACIHVPPPPSNQIVFVTTSQEKATEHEIYDAVWVTGILHTEHSHKEIGDASYTVMADSIEPYE